MKRSAEKAAGNATPDAPAGLRVAAARAVWVQKRLALAMLGVMVVGVAAVYVPQRRSIESTRRELVRTEVELTANQDRASTLPQLVAAVTGLRRQVDQYKPLRDASDVERAMTEIAAINSATRLANYKYDMPADVQRPTCREHPVNINFQADFVDAMSFIQKLEAMDRLTRLRELSITRKDGAKGGEVVVDMSLSLFTATAQ